MENRFEKLLAKLRAREEAEHGPGAFEFMQAKGRLIMSKRAEELTEAEREFMRLPFPKDRN